jgi:hypothetical protein
LPRLSLPIFFISFPPLPSLGLVGPWLFPIPPFYSGLVGPVSFTSFFSSIFKPF